MQATEDKGIFGFTCTSVEQGRGEPIKGIPAGVKKCTTKEYQRVEARFKADPVGFMQQDLGLGSAVKVVVVGPGGMEEQRELGKRTPVFIDLE